MGYKFDYYVYICDSPSRYILLGIVFAYKAILQVMALFLAFRTRRVKVKGLNDSKYIAAIIYVTSIVLAALIVCALTLNKYVNTTAALFGTGILVVATTTLGLTFIPKVSYNYNTVGYIISYVCTHK